MAIEKNNFKVSRFDYEFSPGSKKSISSDEDELQRRTSALESDDDDEFDEADSGAGSDDYDSLEWGDTGVEFCHVDNQTCSIPLELYDLPGLEDILSVDVWNECLSDEERFSLCKFLPDMDQETFMLTLKELFTGSNFHFGSPVKMLFSMLKGGLCEPRVALYRNGLKFFQRRQHYHLLRKHQNNMVSSLCQMRDAWLNCRGYSMDERLRVLNLMRSQKSFNDERTEGLETDSSDRISGEGFPRRFKDKIMASKMPNFSSYHASSNLDFPSGGRLTNLEALEYGKQNSKGTFKMAGSKFPSLMEPMVRLPSAYHDLDINSRPYGSIGDLPQQRKVGGYDSGPMLRIRDETRIGDANEETTYRKGTPRDRKTPFGGGMEKGALEAGKRYEALSGNIFDNFVGLPLSSKGDLYGKNKNVNLFPKRGVVAEKPASMRTSYNPSKKTKLSENAQLIGDQTKSMKGSVSQVPRRGTKVDSEDLASSLQHNKTQGRSSVMDPLLKNTDWNVRGKKWNTGMEPTDLSYGTYRSPSPQVNEGHLLSELRAKPSNKKTKGRFVQKGGSDPASSKGNKKFVRGEETESDSSEQFEDDEDSNPLLRSKLAYPSVMEISQSSLLNSGLDAKKVKDAKKDIKEQIGSLDPLSYSKKMANKSPHDGYTFSGANTMKTRQGKTQDSVSFQELSSKMSEKSYLPVLDTFSDDNDDGKKNSKMLNNGQLQKEPSKRSRKSSSKAFTAEGKQKGRGNLDLSVQSRNLPDYAVNEEDGTLEIRLFEDDYGADRFPQAGLQSESFMDVSSERPDGALLGCNSVKKKRKVKGDMTEIDRKADGELQSDTLQQIKDSTSSKKKTKKRQKADSYGSDVGATEPSAIESVMVDMEQETKSQRNSFPLITPTVHTGFSFSIMHLLSAVRLAMITPLPEDMLEPIKEKKKRHEGDIAAELSHDNKADVNSLEQAEEVNVPSLTVQDIVDRVKSNPGDPSILETQEPLLDLVRGALKIFSSKTAPLGAKGWKMLAVYEKSTKTWSWIGPVSRSSTDYEAIEEATSPEAWGLPHKMLVKLVDSFANWLKSGQETLQLIGSLPAPPASLIHFNVDEKERFRDLRAQKSLNTIGSSTEEVRDYFRREEILRYSIPDRAFSYTAADGKKSIVAPLRRCGGKPTSKARDHFMLKKDRPPHVTILCLVRDAAARLPGSIGTRADVCTLIRDSQYVVEDVSDAQVNQVVSGALDRLHYERDPCVQFDGDRKLWVYLHREREEEDFEDDGTSSTKKWKRPKKDVIEQSSDRGLVTVAFHASGEQSGYDICSDLNTEPSCIDDVKGMEQIYGDVRQNLEHDIDNVHQSDHDELYPGPQIMKASNPMEETKLICQENSTNEDFDDEAFARERPIGFLSASIS
ncbi:Nfrkb, putative isoform 1 [Cucumis melo var. makuwa]|uniref:DEUBAD domain-containing protein n=2 Tax=Cucumis melo TaxID=3656 RepID=A0A9I9DY37_CUCME|nr:Nfrkb, putative isoform 1 [Cucumis melo var. makuwa]TYK14364.1 Nfrkb, putative isoform 1 [Cucumis melo var. makuwa]